MDRTSFPSGFPCKPKMWRWNNLPISFGKTRSKLLFNNNSLRINMEEKKRFIDSFIRFVRSPNCYLRWINSPNSAGRLRNLLLDRSSVRKLSNCPMSLGNRRRLLSLRYNAVRWSNCHSVGLTLRTLPVRWMKIFTYAKIRVSKNVRMRKTDVVWLRCEWTHQWFQRQSNSTFVRPLHPPVTWKFAASADCCFHSGLCFWTFYKYFLVFDKNKWLIWKNSPN